MFSSRSQGKVRKLSLIAIAVPIILLLIVSWSQWRSVADYRDARKTVKFTRQIMLGLESLLSSVNKAESGQRGYLLTHKDSYLQPYEEAVPAITQQLAELRRSTVQLPVQQNDLDRLEPLVKTKLDELAQTVALEKNSDHAGALKIVMSDFGENTMDQIRAVIGHMHDSEGGLLNQRERTYQHTVRRNAYLSVAAIMIGLVFIAMVFFLLRRLERMQEMIKICSWTKLIEYEGEWISFEDYLTRRFHAQISHGMSDVEAKKMLKLINEGKLADDN